MNDRPLVRTRIALLISGSLALIGGVAMAQTTVFKSAFNAPSAPRVRADVPPAEDRHLVEAARDTVAIARDLRRLAFERAGAATRAFAQGTPEAGAALLPLFDAIPVVHRLPPPEMRETVAQLTKLRGLAFDRALMDAEIQQRQQLIGFTEQLARSGNNPELRHVAARSLGDQRTALARAHAMAAEIARSPATSTPRSKAVTVGGPTDAPRPPKPVEVTAPERNAAAELSRREMERVLQGR